MDKAKAAVSDFLGRAGHHDTSVHEKVAPAVEHETVKPHQHENVTTAVDKEVHQDHYHRTVQPVHDREVLPEQHSARVAGVEHREFDNRDHGKTEHHLAKDQAQFRDQRTVEGTTHSQSVAPTVGGEHVHHHIHETIQPVIHKETVQPNVVHTTVPIHEVHHNKATHHDTTSLPAMTMQEFQSKGGALGGREERHDHFEGPPKGLTSGTTGGLSGTVREHEHTSGHHGHHGHHGTTGTTGTTGGLTGSSASGTTGGLAGAVREHEHTSGHHGHHGTTGTTGGLTGSSTSGTTGGLTGSSTSGGLTSHDQHSHADRGLTGQGNMTGSSTQGGVVSSNKTQDNNLTSNRGDTVTSTSGHHDDRHAAKGVVEGISGDGKNELSHRDGEDGSLPKALTEDKSKFIPHPESRQGQEHT